MGLAVYLSPPHKNHKLHGQECSLNLSVFLRPSTVPGSLGASGMQRHVAVWAGSSGHAASGGAGGGVGGLTGQHCVFQGLLGHHVGKTTKDGLQGIAELHQVLGLPGQAVLLAAAGQGRPRGTEGT